MFNVTMTSAPKWLLKACAVAIVLQALAEFIPSPMPAEACLMACGGEVAGLSPWTCTCQEPAEKPETTPTVTVGCWEIM